MGSILFTEGKPALNDKLIGFIKLSKKMSYKNIVLQTNRHLLNYKNYCYKLIINGANGINISIYGSNKKTYDGLACSSGDFNQTQKGLYNMLSIRKKYEF